MSAIDTFEHAHVGYFFSLPIYWVLNNTTNNKLENLTDSEQDKNKIIDQFSLSIGGGSGEHPALIFNNDAVLFQFLLDINEIDMYSNNVSASDIIDQCLYKLVHKVKDEYSYKDEIACWSIDQNQWPLETFIEISKKWNKLAPQEDLAQSMIKAVALFIINEMPLEQCLKDKNIIEFAKVYRTQQWQNAFNKEEEKSLLLGIKTVKENHKSGKIIRDNQVVWGYSLLDWKNDNKPLIEKEEFEKQIEMPNHSKKIKL
jgi:hypothetical protein